MCFSHKKIEKKWQIYWRKKNFFFTDLDNEKRIKKYILAMFPYPSGSGLHIGHIRVYTIADVLARFYRFKGYNVLMPIGWDAFGLPAEQYAIQTNKHPKTFTDFNIKKFKKQLLKMGYSYDWEKEINTSDPNYYRWTQFFFCQIYRKGLADYKETYVYWCEKLGTVLSNEEVKKEKNINVSERGNYPVIRKKILQWIVKITNFAEDLLISLKELDWPNNIKKLQSDWIGINEGTFIDFFVIGKNYKITIFTKSPQTIYGINAIVLSPSHPFLEKIRKNNFFFIEEKDYISAKFTGYYSLHPLSKKKIPIWVANFVMHEYGTGALMINSFSEKIFIHQETSNLISRKEIKQNEQIDRKFTLKYDLPIKEIFKIECEKGIWSFINSPLINNVTNKEEAIKTINYNLELKKKGKVGKFYHLKDWVFSRQRYWGEPIPIIHWTKTKRTSLKKKNLPLILPSIKNFIPNPKFYYSPLQKAKKWISVKNKNGISGSRDINVMPQWAGSCWYYISFLLKEGKIYLDPTSKKAKQRINKWLPVDIYIGGQEHATLHLLYARFWHKFLNKIGIVEKTEPFKKFFCHGLVLDKTGKKMSKSLGNVIDPDELIEKYGADSLRIYEIFCAPPEQTTKFNINGLYAIRKWLKRLYKFSISYKESSKKRNFNFVLNKELEFSFFKMVADVNRYYENLKLNLIVSCLMKFINKCYKLEISSIKLDFFLDFLKLLNPIAPHITEEIWSFFKRTSIMESSWPNIKDKEDILSQYQKKVNIVIQINGKKKEIIISEKGKKKDELIEIAKKEEKVKKWLNNRKINRIVVVSDRLINFVIS